MTMTQMDEARRVAMLAPPTKFPVPAVLDTDTYNEIDDQFALVHALLSPDRIDLQAVYAAPFQNERSDGPADGMRRSYEEIGRVYDRLGRDASGMVYEGSARWLSDKPDEPVASAAAENLVERAMARSAEDEPLYVLAIGAITNIASAIMLEPAIAERVVMVWLSGQPYDWPSARDFNLQQDMAASKLMFDCGVPLVHVPCTNVSQKLRTTTAELREHIAGRSRIGEFLYQRFNEFCQDMSKRIERKRGIKRLAMCKEIWDVAATAYLTNPGAAPSHLAPSPILTDNGTWSRDPRRHLVRVVHDMNRDVIFGDLFAKIAAADQ